MLFDSVLPLESVQLRRAGQKTIEKLVPIGLAL